MPGLYDILTNADGGETMAMLGREFGLTPQQTEAAVAALLPAISTGLKQSTATPEGLGNLLATMGHQRKLYAMSDEPSVAFTQQGRAAGNDVLSTIFGSPEVSRAVADQAQQFSGIGSSILKQMLPVLAELLISGLSKSGKAASPGPTGSSGGGLGDILGQIFGREMSAPSGPPPSPQPAPAPGGQTLPLPTNPGGQPVPDGDLLGYILEELQKGIREGRVKPVIIEGGPVQFPLPGGQGGPVRIPTPGGPAGPTPSGPQAPGGDILGQILRDMLGGGAAGPSRVPQRPRQSPQLNDLSDLSKQLGVMGGAGAAVFGDRFEVGGDVEQDHLDNIQSLFDRFAGTQRR